ncbi:MAG: HTTM domain-containing protein [Pirellulales bacterium]|nr:HTTM domain-containing protein [Pirellulales bacterium]
MNAVSSYFNELTEQFGNGWNQFWFAPRDPYSLCVLRALVGVVALYWQITYAPDLTTFFGPDGLLPLSFVNSMSYSPTEVSYLDFASSPLELWLSQFLGTAVLLAFTVGYFTRVSSILAFIVVISYIHRGPQLTGQAEPILAFLMFYLCFAPCGQYLSVDAWQTARRRAASTGRPDERATAHLSWAATVATRLIQVHLVLVYVMMALAKMYGDAWWNGLAVWWLLARPESRTVDFTGMLASHPYVVNAWTHAQMLFELLFPVLIWNRLGRPLLLGISAVMWGLLALATGLHLFALLIFLAGLSFVEPASMRLATGKLGREEVSGGLAAA